MNTESKKEIKISAKEHANDIWFIMIPIDVIVGILLIIFIVARAIG